MSGESLQPELVRINPHLPRRRAAALLSESPFLDVSPVDTGSSLTQLLKVLRRQRWKLLALMAIAVAAAVIVQLVVPKVYEGSALVRIEHHSGNGMLGQDAVPTNDMDQIITTYIELAQSDPVLRPVAERYHLLEAKGLTPEQVKQRLDAPIALKNLKVTRLPNSYLLHISYRANNPRLAADVANAVAESLSEHAHDTEKRSSEQMSSLVAQSLSSLRTRMEASDKALVEYEKKLNMVNPQQRATIQAARLMQLNTDYTAAQTERVRRQNILREVQSSQSLASAQTAQAQPRQPAERNRAAPERCSAAVRVGQVLLRTESSGLREGPATSAGDGGSTRGAARAGER